MFLTANAALLPFLGACCFEHLKINFKSKDFFIIIRLDVVACSTISENGLLNRFPNWLQTDFLMYIHIFDF